VSNKRQKERRAIECAMREHEEGLRKDNEELKALLGDDDFTDDDDGWPYDDFDDFDLHDDEVPPQTIGDWLWKWPAKQGSRVARLARTAVEHGLKHM